MARPAETYRGARRNAWRAKPFLLLSWERWNVLFRAKCGSAATDRAYQKAAKLIGPRLRGMR